MLPLNLIFSQASLNSDHDTLLELSVSKSCRQAFNGCLKACMMDARRSSHAAGSASAHSHGGYGHASSHSRSEQDMKPQP